MSTNTDWGANFASAGVDAMTAYDEILVPRLFDPWAEVLLDEVGLPPGVAVLDVACGPGTVARLAAERVGGAGRVTACDLSPAMLAVAAAKAALTDAAPITYLQCPADDLKVADSAFDVVLCQQGLQFFPDRVGALREMRRALTPGGRAGVTVWCAIEECPFWDALAGAVGIVLGKEAEAGFRSGPWGLPDPEDLARLFDEAGFSGVQVDRRVLAVVFEGGPAQLVATLSAAVVGPLVAALDDEGRADLLAAAEEALRPFLEDGAVRSEAATNIAVATP
jgi:SAM-dependent methyltransferase